MSLNSAGSCLKTSSSSMSSGVARDLAKSLSSSIILSSRRATVVAARTESSSITPDGHVNSVVVGWLGAGCEATAGRTRAQVSGTLRVEKVPR
eukprot:scaffold1823_cov363-Pavlova_lutheri.AAC.1